MGEAVLNRLLIWCSSRINQKEAMKSRFGLYLGLFQDKIKFDIIKIAGTNGKGSVAAMLSSCLIQEHKKVGLFTSPHLVSINERFRVDDVDVPMQEIEEAALEIELVLKKVVEEHGERYVPSFFDLLVLIALVVFHKHKVEIAVFEAGIGGENDATSLLPGLLSILTSIGLDHQKQLGETLAEIANDKAGIASRQTTLVVNSEIQDYLKEIIEKKAASNQVIVLESGSYIREFKTDLNGTHALASIADEQFELEPSLLGYFQKQNLNVIIEAWLFLKRVGKVKEIGSVLAVKKTKWNARFEVVKSGPTWILDAAHNQQAFESLINALKMIPFTQNRVLLFGNSEEKDFENILKLIPEIAEQAYFVDGFHKAIPQATLIDHCRQVSIMNPGHSDIAQTIDEISRKHLDKIIIVAGSIFMVGIVRSILFPPDRV